MTAVALDPLTELAVALEAASGPAPSAAFDGRIDVAGDDPTLATFVKHQALMRGYQARYILLPADRVADWNKVVDAREHELTRSVVLNIAP